MHGSLRSERLPDRLHYGNAFKSTQLSCGSAQSTRPYVNTHVHTNMASCQKRSHPRRIHHCIETECETEAEKEALVRRMDELISPEGCRSIDNGTLLNAMFDIVQRECARQSTTAAPPANLSPSMMRNSGKSGWGHTINFSSSASCYTILCHRDVYR